MSSICKSVDVALYRMLAILRWTSFSTSVAATSSTSFRTRSRSAQSASTAAIRSAHSASKRPFSMLYACASFSDSAAWRFFSSATRKADSFVFTVAICPNVSCAFR